MEGGGLWRILGKINPRMVARNASGDILGLRTEIHEEVASLSAVEARAMIMGKQMGFKSVINEGNSAIVI
ncbi:hypothetical protein PVK06_049062 [Gossypium arboreum]|uniref:RNase H type-1 domain-containing protein n=1 Tax=Gossypium arboreum TaxID=29729 RepID=A0ABR0MHN8_GOSAR|nr:hypothetical protein PVK06_049062 [Gossypium arboreum]